MLSGYQTIKNSQVVATRDELDLSRQEDLKLFLESAENVYADAVHYQAVAKAEGYKSLSFDDVKGEEIFDALFNLLNELQQQVIHREELVAKGETALDEAVITQLQELYDNMILLRDLVSDMYKGKGQPKVPVVVIPSPIQITQNDLSPKETKKDFTKESDKLFANIEHELEAARLQLEVIRARTLNRIPPPERTADVVVKLDELKTHLSRLKTLKDRVRIARNDVTDVSVLKQTFGNYLRLIEEMVKKSSDVEQELMQRQSEVTMTAKTITSDSTSFVRPTDQQMEVVTHNQQNTAQDIPADAEVVLLIKRVFDEQFYTEAERQKTQEFYESFHRAVASGEQVPTIIEKYQALRDHVKILEESPDINELHGRASRIIQRITAGLDFDDDILRRARTLEHEFRQLESDPETSEGRVRNAYAALLKYAKEHENKWLTVCGMHVPSAGPKGIAAARSLRETLLVERDRHGILVCEPKKQVLVDKLIRKLSSISPQGLSETSDIPEVIRLMRAIDVPSQQSKLVSPAGQSVLAGRMEEEDGEYVRGLGPHDQKHKVMDISTEDKELKIEIRVANKTKELLIKQTEKKAAKAVSKRPQIQPVVPVQNSKVENSIVARTEVRDPINAAVLANVPRVTRISPALEKRSLTKLYLSDPVYQAFISQHYTSPAAFERMLDTVVTQIEKKTIDALERWLHEEYSSPFAFIEELTVGEVLEFGVSQEVRRVLTEENIKYETFLAWCDLIDEMQSVVGSDSNITFGELYARWMIETEMSYYSQSTS